MLQQAKIFLRNVEKFKDERRKEMSEQYKSFRHIPSIEENVLNVYGPCTEKCRAKRETRTNQESQKSFDRSDIVDNYFQVLNASMLDAWRGPMQT